MFGVFAVRCLPTSSLCYIQPTVSTPSIRDYRNSSIVVKRCNTLTLYKNN